MRIVVLAAMACTLALAGQPGPGGQPLNLSLQRDEPGQLLLTWNPASRDVVGASHAVLRIQDGRHNEEIKLDAAQLQSGRFSYRNLTADLAFLLEVTTAAGGSVSSEIALTLDPKSPLNAMLEFCAGQWTLTWNRDAQAVAQARRGVLSITDGDHLVDTELDVSQIKNGSVIYSPITNDIGFRLEVSPATGPSLSTSVRGRARPKVDRLALQRSLGAIPRRHAGSLPADPR